MKRINLRELELERDESDPEGYRAGMARFGSSIGASMLGGTVYELAAGPEHLPLPLRVRERGVGDRARGPADPPPPGRRRRGRAARVVCFPVGPDGAHKFTNRTDETVRVLLLSTRNDPAMAVYPNSDKIGAWPGPGFREDHVLVRRESHTDYFDREL